MSRKLAIIAAAALSFSAVLLVLAYAIGGDNVFHDPQSLKGMKPLIDLATRREWHWTGGDSLAMDAPINVRYQPHGAPNVTVSGPAGVVEHVQFADGRIGADANVAHGPGQKLQAVISGVPIRKFVVNGGETLELGHVDQDRMDIHVNGDGQVEGDGRVGRLNLVISGSGDALLGRLAVGSAKVTLLGSGNAVLAPHDRLEVFVAGSGSVQLVTKPKHVSQTVVGSGGIEPAPPVPPAPAAPPVPVISPRNSMPPVPPLPPEIFMHGSTATNTGSHDSDLGTITQDHLDLGVMGGGSVTAAGHVNRLKLNVAGSGDARLGALAVKDAVVMVTGSGDVTLAPTGNVKITIIGSGSVKLLTHPAGLTRVLLGSGRVIEAH